MGASFDRAMESHQVEWRSRHIKTTEWGKQNGRAHAWLLPRPSWPEHLWRDLRNAGHCNLEQYLRENKIQPHTGVHNLKSSWVLCANLYFPFRSDRDGLNLLAAFLRQHVSQSIKAVTDIDLEYAEEKPLDPSSLLGEPEGRRGANQTSPDVAFKVILTNGRSGLVLVESKFTEHSFYECSGRKPKYDNPDRQRCVNRSSFGDPETFCWLLSWQKNSESRSNRKYWSYIRIRQPSSFVRCPAAISGYQLFRQQALAEALAERGEYDLVVSCVAYDDRNIVLIESLARAGLASLNQWGTMFDGKAKFATFTHQTWVSWVQMNDSGGRWGDWCNWVEDRYGFGHAHAAR
jgi:hypothetical protein